MEHLCLNCEKAGMVRESRDVVAEYVGFRETVPAVYGWHCPQCGELEFLDDDGAQRFTQALDHLQAAERAFLMAVRKRLKMTQQQAARLTGGGKNAFSLYERGEAKPMPAVVNLFRLLDRHPELLKELQP